MSAKQKILARLQSSLVPLAVHEILIPDVSQCAASARLREMARDGLVKGSVCPGKSYKIWTAAPVLSTQSDGQIIFAQESK